MVCVPEDTTDGGRPRDCETDFDCGFSVLENGWSRCRGGRCVRVVE